MKKIVSVAVILVLLLVVAPWGIGRVAEKRVNAGLDQLVEQAPYLKIVERKWTRGWFRSEQEVTVEMFGDMFRSMEAIQKAGTGEATPAEGEVVAAADEAQPAEEATVETAPAPAEGDAAASSGSVAEGAAVPPVAASGKLVMSPSILAATTVIPVRAIPVRAGGGGGSGPTLAPGPLTARPHRPSRTATARSGWSANTPSTPECRRIEYSLRQSPHWSSRPGVRKSGGISPFSGRRVQQ